MAEGILGKAASDLWQVYSAGSRPTGYVHPLAVAALVELGIDILGHTSKHLDAFSHHQIDTVITVCGKADQICPNFPGQINRYHWGFDDPAQATGTDEQVMEEFRRVRDQIKLVFEAFASGYRQAQTTLSLG